MTFTIAIAAHIGKVQVDMNGTPCKVPAAVEYINKCISAGTIGSKRKMASC